MSAITSPHKHGKFVVKFRKELCIPLSTYGLHQNTFKINVPSSSSILRHPNTYFSDSKPFVDVALCPNKNFTASSVQK